MKKSTKIALGILIEKAIVLILAVSAYVVALLRFSGHIPDDRYFLAFCIFVFMSVLTWYVCGNHIIAKYWEQRQVKKYKKYIEKELEEDEKEDD
jgi:hypothetical protein